LLYPPWRYASTWKQFTPAVGSYLDRHPSPGMILIQVGSNDLGSTKGFELVHDIECDLLRLRVLLPDVKIDQRPHFLTTSSLITISEASMATPIRKE
jgi:hypothetical protein